MSPLTRSAAPTALAALVLALSACSGPPPAEDPRPNRSPAATDARARPHAGTAPVLRAELASPTDIDLSWRDVDGAEGTEASGHVLEFATDAAGPYTVLRYLPRGVTGHRHPDLMPRTTFHYRLRAFRGPASGPVDVALPPGAPGAQDESDESDETDENTDHGWLPPRTDPARTVRGRPLGPTGGGAPTDLKAAVKHANGILFRWTDNSSDEEGFLLEVRTRDASGYVPVAVLDRDVNAVGLITLPSEKRASYRVRAFTYGARSNVVRRTTGLPTGG
ncbi:fibronectin type III domain-containing protein [Streptomyces fructofermentans]|uniref:Fibronectin type III domain-containing protein n=1 Tax=Streptomyces fructofermentans TaxID=152141 RepID=A0A918NCE0_9ACTN|nr:fibronectin type III domain-containing protein [Streptomyces fructofermentans]GGX57371.1 hypothetical protein GCM10010515_26190 [Streptomyces fructofermentans]